MWLLVGETAETYEEGEGESVKGEDRSLIINIEGGPEKNMMASANDRQIFTRRDPTTSRSGSPSIYRNG